MGEKGSSPGTFFPLEGEKGSSPGTFFPLEGEKGSSPGTFFPHVTDKPIFTKQDSIQIVLCQEKQSCLIIIYLARNETNGQKIRLMQLGGFRCDFHFGEMVIKVRNLNAFLVNKHFYVNVQCTVHV